MFVKLKAEAELTPTQVRELRAALRELSATGAYKVLSKEADQGEVFYHLMGAMTPHSSALFRPI